MFISYSDYIRSDTHSFEEKNEVKFKQDKQISIRTVRYTWKYTLYTNKKAWYTWKINSF